MSQPDLYGTSSQEKQDAVLAFLREWQGSHPYGPTIREIMAGTGISTTSVVVYNLRLLRDKGLAGYIDGEARTAHLAGSRYLLPEPAGVGEG